MTQNASFHQCPVCTVYLDKIDLKSKIQYFFFWGGGDIICDPSIYKMDHPDLIVLNFQEKSIALQRVNSVSRTKVNSLSSLFVFVSGNYFGSHFIMGGERFDMSQPESYLFGENTDLNFLGCKPIPVS